MIYHPVYSCSRGSQRYPPFEQLGPGVLHWLLHALFGGWRAQINFVSICTENYIYKLFKVETWVFFISNRLIGLQTVGLDTGMLTPRYVMLRSRPVESIHMTSRRPYWCSKPVKRRPCWCAKKILWELNSFLI